MDILQTLAAVMTFVAGGYFTVKIRAFYFLHPIKTLKSVPRDGVRQMLLSLGGTVGVGNISGVAVAIMLGGAGSVFWMWIGAFFAMALKYAEITLGMVDKKGAQYYIKKGLGTFAAALFSAMLILDVVLMGGMIQSSAIAEATYTAFGISPFVSGIVVSLLASSVFFFKVDLFRLSSYVVPFMSLSYTALSLTVIFANIERLPQVFSEIFRDAFSLDSAAGGIFGFMFTPSMRQGIVKGLFSNEAGCGTAPSAHATSSEKVPARQGLFGIFEVFVDTVLMCTLTALVILVTIGDNLSQIGGGGIGICVRAFEMLIGSAASPVLAAFVFLFAFSAIVSFGYYGMQTFKNNRTRDAFLLVYCFSLMLGAVSAPLAIWSIADAVICTMLLLNTSAVFVLRRTVLKLHKCFYTHMGNASHRASSTSSFCFASTKNEIPMSETDTKRGSISRSRQNFAK
ncbi:MAG: alanine:cation symporter family protein [Ruminococcaceae bacterium]|nr:alanine:cation symporter family protein [Oscillospiraceae bacterium]